jgi:hypothetical protein
MDGSINTLFNHLTTSIRKRIGRRRPKARSADHERWLGSGSPGCTAIQDGVVRFGSIGQPEYCAVMEVAGSQESLAKVDDAKQEELLAAYCQFLNSVTFAFQLVVQVHPVDLSWYVTRVE